MNQDVKIVSIGGGTGQSVLLGALRKFDADITAIVSMGDDGGSTGALRRSCNTPAPGDIRKCLVALAEDPEGLKAKMVAHRMQGVFDHALGNLMLLSLYEETGDFMQAIQFMQDELNCKGTVMPSTLDDVVLHAKTKEGHLISGQAKATHGVETLQEIWMEPKDAKSYAPCAQKIREADLVVLGPGSIFTSIIPNILFPDIRKALLETDAVVCFVCPKSDTEGESHGMRAIDYIEMLNHHGLEGAIDVVLLHDDSLAVDRTSNYSQDTIVNEDGNLFPPVCIDKDQIARIHDMGLEVIVDNFESPEHPYQHNSDVLYETLKGVLLCHLQQKQKMNSHV